MKFDVNGHSAFASTGGRDHEPGKPNLVFVHGSGQSRLTWTQQSRKAAYRGYNVLALDLPGHGHSTGDALATIEAQADWIITAMDAVGFETATLVGHSQGCLNALEIASRYAHRTDKIVLVAAALKIPVNDKLVDWALNKPARAFSAMTGWGHGELGHKHDNTVPGHSHLGGGINIMAMNAPGSLHADLMACNAYQNGAAAAEQISCPALVVLAENDKMTPIKFGRKMLDAIENAEGVEMADTGHFVPVERPQILNETMFEFLER